MEVNHASVPNQPIRQLSALRACEADIQAAFRLLEQAYRQGNKLLLCGNGRSASDCEHLVDELMKDYLSKRPLDAAMRHKFVAAEGIHGAYLADHLQGALPAISLVSQTSLLTAFANDVATDMMFAQQVYGYGRPGDVLLGISTSGNGHECMSRHVGSAHLRCTYHRPDRT